ncbi:MAG TPA: DNA cytosine methyltransferase, partial [Bdellovibrio sp.]|nr:DNA cytosine methyltransferase [Bdellovibrio sp.]
MAKAGLGDNWSCLFANDFDPKKGQTYLRNWSAEYFKICDVKTLKTDDLPSIAQMAWASFPCQDLSLAGAGAGLKGKRSGTFWPFWKLMIGLIEEERAPRIIVLENVCGTLTSHSGKDFESILDALMKASYRFGALIIDAALFVPQSRRRLFIIAVKEEQLIPGDLVSKDAIEPWHTSTL